MLNSKKKIFHSYNKRYKINWRNKYRYHIKRIRHNRLIFLIKRLRDFLCDNFFRLYLTLYFLHFDLLIKNFRKVNYQKKKSITKFVNYLDSYISMTIKYINEKFDIDFDIIMECLRQYYKLAKNNKSYALILHALLLFGNFNFERLSLFFDLIIMYIILTWW